LFLFATLFVFLVSVSNKVYKKEALALLQTALLQEAGLAVYTYLQEPTLLALQAYIEAAPNPKHRLKQWVEFFKTLEWFTLETLDKSLVKRLPLTAQKLVLCDVTAYYRQQEAGKQPTGRCVLPRHLNPW
jgi:hypothetical protein